MAWFDFDDFDLIDVWQMDVNVQNKTNRYRDVYNHPQAKIKQNIPIYQNMCKNVWISCSTFIYV